MNNNNLSKLYYNVRGLYHLYYLLTLFKIYKENQTPCEIKLNYSNATNPSITVFVPRDCT